MPEIVSTLTSKGQVTIPAEVRKHLKVGEHDKIIFVIEPNGEVKIKAPKYPNVDSLVGVAGTLREPLSWEEMRILVREERIKAKYGDNA